MCWCRSRSTSGGGSSRPGSIPEQLVAKPNLVYPEPRVEPREIRRQVLFVGRDIPTKGLQVLLEALDLMGDAAPPLLVAGVTSVPQIYGVQFLGPVPHARVLDLMAESMAVVVPSVWAEPFGRVAIEAMAVGTPTIVSKVGGLPETRPEVAVEANDPDKLAAGIRYMTELYDGDADKGYYRDFSPRRPHNLRRTLRPGPAGPAP